MSPALFCLALGFACLYGSVRQEALFSAYTGIASDKTRLFYCGLTADSGKTSGGSMMYRARITAVEDLNGTRASARGEVIIFAKNGRALLRGDRIFVRGRFVRGENGGAFLCFTDAGNIFPAVPDVRYAEGKNGFERPRDFLFSFRRGLLLKFTANIMRMDREPAALFLALFLGNRDELPANLVDGFRKSGTSHVLALSGMHLGIVSGILALIFKPVAGKRGAFCLSLVFIFLFIFLAGPKPSLLRAGFMYVLGGVFLLKRAKIRGLHILLSSFFILTALNPFMLRELSFQLSFLALFGIFTAGRYFDSFMNGVLPSFIRLPLCASLGAQCAVSPLIAFVFGAVYPIGIIASLLLSPLVLIFMWTGMVLMCFPANGFFVFDILNKAAHYLYDVMIMIISKAALVPPLVFSNLSGKIFLCLFCVAIAGSFLAGDGMRLLRIAKRR